METLGRFQAQCVDKQIFNTQMLSNKQVSLSSSEDSQIKRMCQDLDFLTYSFDKLTFELDEWQEMAKLAQSNDMKERYEATKQFRLMLSSNGEIPIQTVLDTGIVPSLVKYLSQHNFPELQFEAAWALTNIASGTSLQTETVVQHNAIPEFVSLLNSPKEKIREQCMWGLGNFAGDRPEFRDMILSSKDCIKHITNALNSCSKVCTRRTGVWMMSNLCRGHPRPEISLVLPLMDVLIKMITLHDDTDILSNACWALDGLVEHNIALKNILSQHEAIKQIIKLMMFPSPLVNRPALGIIGQIATGGFVNTSLLMKFNVLEGLVYLLKSERRSIRKEACWVLSNISISSELHIQQLINEGVYTQLSDVFSTEQEFEVKKEAAWTISTAYIAGSPNQVMELLTLDNMKLMCEMLEINDSKVLTVVLDALDRIMSIGDTQLQTNCLNCNPYVQLFLEVDGLIHVLQLQQFPDNSINIKIYNFLTAHFNHLPQIHTWFGN